MYTDLAVGARRHGSLVDFDPATPKVAVILERDVDGIHLVVPWPDYDSYYAGWFVDRHASGQRGAVLSEVPKQLLFEDQEGGVLLVGCRPAGYRTTMFGPGTGQIQVRYAVLGVRANIDFQKVHGIRWQISGLVSWLGSQVIRDAVEQTERGSHKLTIVAEAPDPIEIPGHRELQLIPTWDTDESVEAYTIRNLVLVESRGEAAADWAAFQVRARALRDLLVVSQWKSETYSVRSVLRRDDPLMTLDGTVHGEQWRDAVVAGEPPEAAAVEHRDDLIRFVEVGTDGIARWLELRDEFARALDPVLSARDLDRVTPLTLLAQTGPGLEALGYLLLIEDGQSPKQAAATILVARLTRILSEVANVLPFDGEEWVAETAKTYNGIKHANRVAPREIDVLNRWRESVLIVRAWVALRLGVSPDVLKGRLESDSQARQYVEAK